MEANSVGGFSRIKSVSLFKCGSTFRKKTHEFNLDSLRRLRYDEMQKILLIKY
jgi:hypothetical protein